MAEPGALGGGFTSGMLGSELDLQNIQLNQFKLAEAPIKLQEEQISLAKDKISLQQDLTMLRLMSGMKPGDTSQGPDAIAETLNQIAMIQMQAGRPDAAAKTAGEAARITDTASKVDYRSYKMQNDRLSRFANILGTVPDSPGGLAQALQTMAAADPGVARDKKFQQIAQQGWRPGLIPALKQQVLTVKEQAEVDYRKKAGDHAEAAAAVDRARVPLIRAQTKLAEDRDKLVQKAGGAVVKAGQLAAITDMAKRDYAGADEADIKVRSRPLAEEMVRMMREQHLTESEAATRVYEKARSSGVFSGLRTSLTMKGTKPGKPLELPKSADKIQQNQWYMVDGVPKLALGTKFYSEDELRDIEDEDKDLLGEDDERAD